MGGIIQPGATVFGAAAAPGIPVLGQPLNGLYKTAPGGVGVAISGIAYETLDTTRYALGPAPVGAYALSAVAGSPFAVANTPVCFNVSPNGLYAIFGLNTGAASVYKINANGSLTFLASYALGGGPPTWVEFSPDGNFVYIGLYGPGTTAQYSINNSTGVLTALGAVAIGNSGSSMEISPDGLFVYDVSSSGFGGAPTILNVYTRNQVSGLINNVAVSTVNMGALGNPPVKLSIGTGGVYISANSTTLYLFSRNTVTGAVTALAPIVAPAVCNYVEESPDNTCIYFTLQNNTIAGYSVNAATGALTPLNGSPYAAPLGGLTGLLSFTPGGTFAYAVGLTGATLLSYSRDIITGVLTTGPSLAPGLVNARAVVALPGNNYIYTLDNSANINAVQTAATVTHPLMEAVIDPAGLAGSINFNCPVSVNGQSIALPSGVGNQGKFLRVDSTTGTTMLWDGVNTVALVAMVGNAGAFTIDDTADYLVDVSGALTAAGALTATLAVALPSTKVVFDNSTTGGFPVILNGAFNIPPGRSIWYYNGVTFEEATTSMLAFSIPMVGNAAQFTFPNYRTSLCDISGVLTANGNITATMPANSGVMIFDNSTTGGFAVQINATYTIPPGITVWYWNSATLEKVASGGFRTGNVTPLPTPVAVTQYAVSLLLGGNANLLDFELICLAPDNGYAVGQIVRCYSMLVGGVVYPLNIYGAASAAFTFPPNATFAIQSLTTGLYVAPTPANWAWRFFVLA